MKDNATGCLKRDFDGLGWDGLMFGASAMWFDSGAFRLQFCVCGRDQHVRNACLLRWRVPVEVWEAGVRVNPRLSFVHARSAMSL